MVLLIAATVRVGQQVRQHLLSIMYAVRHIYELWAYVVLGDETMNGSVKGFEFKNNEYLNEKHVLKSNVSGFHHDCLVCCIRRC